jgi:hypothetical protein
VEDSYHRLSADELTVWDREHPKPEGGPEFERQLLRWWTEDTAEHLDAMLPTNLTSLEDYRRFVRTGVRAVVGRDLSSVGSVEWTLVARENVDSYQRVCGLLSRKLTLRECVGFAANTHADQPQEQIPLIFLRPMGWTGRTCVMVFPEGKVGMFGDDGKPTAAVERLLAAGVGVCGADLLYQGEFLKDGQPLIQTRRVANTREAAAYTFGYNHCVFAQRVHDILSILTFLKQGDFQSKEIDLVGTRGAGHWVSVARCLAPQAVARLAVDTAGFRFAQIRALHDPDFLPGGARYHDLPGMLAIAAPAPLWLAGEGNSPPAPVHAAYRAANQPQALHVCQEPQTEDMQAAIDWLLSE